MKHLLKDERIVSISATVIIHLILFLLFIAIHVDFSPMIAEFVEVSFAAPVMSSRDESIPELPEENLAPELAEEEVTPQKMNLQDIELPERRQLELQEEEIVEKVQPDLEKKFEGPPVIKKSPQTTLPERRDPVTSSPFSKREKDVMTPVFERPSERRETAGSQKIPVNLDESFEIDWEGDIVREVYQKRLPEFPPDVQREATIKIRFTVSPDGVVKEALLLQKGDTRLENLTLETFRFWRFSPLPSYAEQTDQTGVITFHFKLQ